MERTQREAAKRVDNYRKYHLSGDISSHIEGKVARAVTEIESPIKTGVNTTPRGSSSPSVYSSHNTDSHTSTCNTGEEIGTENSPEQDRSRSRSTPHSYTAASCGPHTHYTGEQSTQRSVTREGGNNTITTLTYIDLQESEALTCEGENAEHTHNASQIESPQTLQADATNTDSTHTGVTASYHKTDTRYIQSGDELIATVNTDKSISENPSVTGDARRADQPGAADYWSRDHHKEKTDTYHATMAEALKLQLAKRKEESEKMAKEMEELQLRNDIEREEQSLLEKKLAMEKLTAARTEAQKRHIDRVEKLKNYETLLPEAEDDQLEWLKKKMEELQNNPQEKLIAEQNKQAMQQMETLLEKQKELVAQAENIKAKTGTISPELNALFSAINTNTSKPVVTVDEDNIAQNRWVEQLKVALANKDTSLSGDWQKDALRQFLVNSNKTIGPGGVSTLKPELLKRLTGEEEEFSMAEWLARLNKQEQGEFRCEETMEECSHKKIKSGILDRATSNIVHKEVWPQKNLLEDWADEEIDFKHLQFEQLIAGEVRTIEICTEPAQILGRLRLLRRMAYAKLRGYEWPLIRKMYAAIVRSIEAKEYSWEDNFDRFETILYRRLPTVNRNNKGERYDRDIPQKKWFCRDWNKQEGCTKQAPHKAWFGTGSNAISRTVLHMCAVCYLKDKAQRDHPEYSDSCHHKQA